jgi:DNA-binding response OmpR family regulator
MTMKPHVLVVDDSLTVRMDLRAALSGAGFQVTACETKMAALKALKTRSFALVILDVNLPDGNGVELLVMMRGTVEWSQVPIMMLSNETQVKSRIRGLIKGADEYVGKPYDSAYVVARARELTRSQEPFEDPNRRLSAARKVLLVEDSASFAALVVKHLQKDGHDVVIAYSGEEALELLAVDPVDAILLDLVLPGIDGLETCKRLKHIHGRERIPIMILTSSEDSRAHEDALGAGADEVVVKSPDLDQVRLRLRALLAKARLNGEREGGQAPPSSRGGPASAPRSTRLFEQIIAASGLSDVIARGTLQRALRRSGIDYETLSPGDLVRALPALREALSLFLPPPEVERRVQTMAALARLSSGPPASNRQ